jgi:hypothetical protein
MLLRLSSETDIEGFQRRIHWSTPYNAAQKAPSRFLLLTCSYDFLAAMTLVA